jgi:hypothetical protein
MNPVPVFRYSMSQDLILYRNWVNLRISRGLGTEAADFKRKERTFMYNWQRALMDIKESVRLASKSESEVIKFNAKDWLKWYKSIDNHFRRTLGVQGVMLDWVYREQAEPKPRVKYPSIAAEIKATLILSGNHFEEDSASVFAIVATSTFDTTAYSYVKMFEDTRNGREVMLALNSSGARLTLSPDLRRRTRSSERLSSAVRLANTRTTSTLHASTTRTMSSH